MRKFNLSLDDFSPHERAGLKFESIFWCDRLIEKYPKIKINLFIPLAFCRLGETPRYLSKNPEWVKRVKELPDNYRVNLHGLFHRRSKKDYKWHRGIESNNNEWELLTYDQATMLLDKIEAGFNDMGIKYRKVFRPPGWHIGFHAAQALSDKGFLIAGNDKYFNKFCDKVKNLKWKSYNWDLTKLCNVKGDIVACGHTSNWCNNHMDETRYKIVDDLLSGEEFDFRFIEGML